MSLSGSSYSRNRSWAHTRLAMVSSTGVPRKMIRSLRRRQLGRIARPTLLVDHPDVVDQPLHRLVVSDVRAYRTHLVRLFQGPAQLGRLLLHALGETLDLGLEVGVAALDGFGVGQRA